MRLGGYLGFRKRKQIVLSNCYNVHFLCLPKANEPKERAPWPLDPSLTDTLRSSDLPGVWKLAGAQTGQTPFRQILWCSFCVTMGDKAKSKHYLIITKSQWYQNLRWKELTEDALCRPIRAVKKARKGCGHDVHNWRSGQGWPVCQPHRPDDQVEVQQPESILFTGFIALRLVMQLSYTGDQINR